MVASDANVADSTPAASGIRACDDAPYQRGARATTEVARAIEQRYDLQAAWVESPLVRTLHGLERETGRGVIVKAIRAAEMARGTRARVEFEAEVRQSLECGYLAPVTHYEYSGDELYVIMPRTEGIPLSQLLAQRRLSVSETVAVGMSIFSALGALHERGALHRDISPDNVVVKLDESIPARVAAVTLIGFDTEKRFHPDQVIGERECEIVGYMSPEEAGSIDVDVGPSSDHYSAGILLFRCLAGQVPFRGQNAGTILFEHVTAPVPFLQNIDSEIPRELDELVQRLLRKDPHDRYQQASAVVDDLVAIEDAMQRGITGTHIAIGASDRRCTLTEPAFVARDNELQTVADFVDHTKRGNGTTLLLEGESGSGKSRLLAESCKQARGEGLRVFQGQATTQGGQRPFRVLEGIVDGFISAVHDDRTLADAVRERLDDLTEILVAALPRLSPVLPTEEVRDQSPAAFGENRTIEALIRFFEVVGSQTRPALIVLDDCQWADDLTYKLIRRWHSMPRGETRHTSLIVGFRSEEVPADHVIRSIDTQFQVALAPLGHNEIRQLAESMAGTLPSGAIDVVTRLADGSPFMASAVLRGLVESGALVNEGGEWKIVPRELEELQSSREAASLLARRIELLPQQTIDLLSAGALIGKEFGLDIAANLAGLEIAAAVEALAQARDRRLIWARADGGQFVFVHDKIRSSLLCRLSPDAQQQLHWQAAEYLENHSSSRASEIAFHFDKAGAADKAFPYALSAAEQARQQFSLDVAERQYRIAQRGATNQSNSVRFRIAEGLGDSLMLRGHYVDAAPLFEEAAALAEGSLSRAKIQGKLAELSFKRGDMESATEGFETALRTLGRRVPRNMLVIVMVLIWEACWQVAHTWLPGLMLNRLKRPPNESERLAISLYSLLTHGCWYCRTKIQCLWAHLRGLNLAERYAPSSELANAYSEHAPVMCLLPLFGRAIRYAQRSLELRKHFNDVWGQGQSLNFYSVVLYAAGQYRECIEKGRESIRLLERTGDYWQVHIARYQVAASLYHLGDFKGALAEALTNHRSGIELGDEQASGIILDVWARATRGDVPEAIAATELSRKRQDAQGMTQVLLAIGIRELHAGRIGEAIDFLERATKTASKAGIQNAYTLPAPTWLATAYRMQAETVPAHAPRLRRRLLLRASRAANRAVRSGKKCPNDYPRALREAALVASMLGRYRRARQLFDRSLQMAQRLEANYEYALTLQHKGQVGQLANWPNASNDEAEGSRQLSTLTTQDDSDSTNEGTSSLGTLSLIDRFDTVLDIGRRIASALTIEKIYEESGAGATRLLRSEHCAVLEFDSDSPNTLPRVVSGPTWLLPNEDHLRLAVDNGRAMAFVEESTLTDSAEASVGRRSAIYVPIWVRNQLAACLYATHSQVLGFFAENEERLADFVGTIAGAAMENAQGFHDLTQLNTTLEQRVADRTAAAEARATELGISNQQLTQTAKELRSAEEQLRIAKDAAERANEAKSRFLATMSHEIRTPLNGILGMTELTLRSSLTTQQRNCLSVVRQSGDALLNLLNDILDLSKIEAGKLVLEEIPMSPREVIGNAVKLMGVNAADKHVELINRIDPSVPVEFACDPCRLRQVIVNLVGNAIKFTEAGEVEVRTTFDFGTNDGESLHVSVRDTGAGIAKEKQELIFQSFEQSDSSTTRRYGGTGLGLSISSQIVTAMGGRMWVESELGEGSTFHFAIPVKPTADTPTVLVDSALAGQQIMICSNRPVSRDSYVEVLSAAGARCEIMSNDPVDFHIWLDSMASSNEKCLLLLDWDAASEHPPELLGKLKQNMPSNVSLLVLVPATCVLDSVDDTAETWQFSLPKPALPDELIGAVRDALKPQATPASMADEPELTHETGLHVLLADDAMINQEVAIGILELLGHSCEVASTGQEAVDAYQRSEFDLILMDLEMPELDGMQATRAIRELEAVRGDYTPIIAMTAHAVSGIRDKCLEAGMDDYIAKPVQPDTLNEVLNRIGESRFANSE